MNPASLQPGDPAINSGARPADEPTEAAAAAHVRGIFDSIAPSYDRLNHLLSFGLDRRWWRRCARAFADILARPDARVLDLCCGTGDLTAALLAYRPQASAHLGAPGLASETWVSQDANGSSATAGCPIHDDAVGMGGVGPINGPGSVEPITGLDFSPEMLARARAKFPAANILWVEADAMHLPYPDNTFDLITSAFGFRNLTNYAAALAEIHRVLRPGGSLGILEANQPGGLSGALYTLYFHHILPLVGGLISGDRAAYRYLPASVARFPRPPQMLALLTAAGFRDPAWDGYLLHAAGLYRAIKP